VVTKDTLLATVWPETAVTEGVLKTYIGQIRQALGETARTPTYIETIPRRGYRFILQMSDAATPQTEAIAPHHAAALPLVGRTAELEQLRSHWERTCRGERQVVAITGEAGIGKTSLVDTFMAQLASPTDVRIGRGQCIEQFGAGEPYMPLLEALGRLARGPQGASLMDALRQQAPSWLAHLPALVTPEEAAALQLRDGNATRERMLRELAEAVESLSAVSPLILILEDLHWSDASTVEWLAYVARRRDPARLFILGTYRSVEAIVSNHPVRAMTQELQQQRQGGQLALGYLTEANVAAYLAQRLGDAPLPASLPRLLHQRTSGNPLFLATLVDDIVRQGELAGLAARDTASIEAPESLRHMIERQVEQLAPEDQTLLEAASVVGAEFAAPALAAAIGDASEAIETRLNILHRQGRFVQARDTSAWPDGTVAAQYKFRHALYREVLYERAPISQRARWHGRIGARLELAYGAHGRQLAAELAEHFARAHDAPRAFVYLCQAADNAMRRYAVQEALGHYSQALDMVEMGIVEVGARELSELHIQRGRLYAQTGAIARAQADFEAALQVARATADRTAELQALYALGSYGWATDYQAALQLFDMALPLAESLDDIATQVRILSRMSILYTNRLQLAKAFDYGHRALALARQLGNQRILALAMDSIEVAAAFVGDVATLDDMAPQLVALHRGHNDLWYLQFALYQGCYAPIGAGRWDDAITQLEEVLAINGRIGDRVSEPIFEATLAWVHRSCGDYAEALQHGRRAVAQSEELGNAESTAWSAASLGWTLLEVYAWEEAACCLQRGLKAAEGSMALCHALRCIGSLAWAHWLMGKREDALALAAQAEALCQQITAPPGQAFIQGMHAYVGIAWVYLAAGQVERAEQLINPILIAAETSGWQEAIAYGSLVVGQGRLASGDAAGAEAALQCALQVSQGIALPGVAWKTHAALSQYFRNCDRLDDARLHQLEAKRIVEQLARTLSHADMRQRFLERAL
jgi:tetratricopeptide (TPR) repeat protein